MKYNPHKSPDPQRWQALDESSRIELVEQFHRNRRIELPDERLHAVVHVIIESQIAMGDELPVAATLDRLMREGLDRHDAIHAIGSVLTEHMWAMQQPGAIGLEGDANRPYFEELEKLTKQVWHDRHEEEE